MAFNPNEMMQWNQNWANRWGMNPNYTPVTPGSLYDKYGTSPSKPYVPPMPSKPGPNEVMTPTYSGNTLQNPVTLPYWYLDSNMQRVYGTPPNQQVAMPQPQRASYNYGGNVPQQLPGRQMPQPYLQIQGQQPQPYLQKWLQQLQPQQPTQNFSSPGGNDMWRNWRNNLRQNVGTQNLQGMGGMQGLYKLFQAQQGMR